MKLKIWSKDPPKEEYHGNPPPSYEVELEGGEVITIEDKYGNTLFSLEVGSTVVKEM